ncbi:polyketide cyclase [Gordonia iterans]|uniref:Polyketide cyclase n=1 Tax=Gordonia iterans TaxID=1004901 RepID=A0A2S0KHR5_9ACTN|nr:SRPBCC family protein [Gordonia iterans]AVM01238.1 polyketide cyclase [Gordonia iterans]
MGEVNHEAVIKAPREKVFAYIDDYRNVPEYMFGVSRFTPTTEVDHGLGSVFQTVIKIGPKELKSTVKCVEWVENEKIRLESVSGMGANTTWSFADGDDGTTVLHAEFDFTLPGGLTGKVLGGLIGPFVEQGVKYTDGKVRAACES